MANEAVVDDTGRSIAMVEGLQGVVADWSSDQRAFKRVPWGKAMMWIFLLSDTFIFACFLTSYMMVRISTTVPWPNPSEVFALTLFGHHIPLILIAIMTFILISSSGTMAMAVKFGYEKNRKMTTILLLVTAMFGASFVGMQAFEWTKLIEEGVRPWGNPMGAAQFGSCFFMMALYSNGRRLARRRCRLVFRSASLQAGSLGQGNDVDLPAQRHLYLRLFPNQLHDGAYIHHRTLAQSQRSIRVNTLWRPYPVDPDRHHDVHTH